MRHKQHVTAVIFAALTLILYLTIRTGSVQAAPIVPGNGLRITPAITQLALQPGQDSVSMEYAVTNLTDQPLSIALSARDFGALSLNGSISLYSADYNPNSNPHGIQSYISLPSSNVVVAPHTSQQVSVSVLNANRLAPGGHYGAILFSPKSALASATSNRVALNTSVASIIFLTTANGGTMNLKANITHINFARLTLPNNLYVVFSNTGNTQTVPQGQLTLYGLHNQVLGTTDINTTSGLVLPGGSRIFNLTFMTPDKWYTTLPGVYHMKLMYKDSADKSFKTINQAFFYINWQMIALLVVALLLTVLIVRRVIMPLAKKLRSLFKKKPPTTPEPQEKPKRPPRLIQG